jgi:hypothetical protein
VDVTGSRFLDVFELLTGLLIFGRGINPKSSVLMRDGRMYFCSKDTVLLCCCLRLVDISLTEVSAGAQ